MSVTDSDTDGVWYDPAVGEFLTFEVNDDGSVTAFRAANGLKEETFGAEEFRDVFEECLRISDDVVQNPVRAITDALSTIQNGESLHDVDGLELDYAREVVNMEKQEDAYDLPDDE